MAQHCCSSLAKPVVSSSCLTLHNMGKVRLEKLDARMLQRQQKQQQTGGRQPKNFTGGAFMENLNAYDLILKLGRLGAYDSSRRIRGPDGEFVQNTDIAHLIEEAMRPSRVVNGADAFIELLVASKINPDTIANDTIRAKLIQRLEQPPDASGDGAGGDTTQIYGEEDEDNTAPEIPRGVSTQDVRHPTEEEVNRILSTRQQPVVRLERLDLNNHVHST